MFGAQRRINPCGSLASGGIELNMNWMKKVKIVINTMDGNNEFLNDIELQYDY